MKALPEVLEAAFEVPAERWGPGRWSLQSKEFGDGVVNATVTVQWLSIEFLIERPDRSTDTSNLRGCCLKWASAGEATRADLPLLMGTSAGREWMAAQLRMLRRQVTLDCDEEDRTSSHRRVVEDVGPTAEAMREALAAAGWSVRIDSDGAVIATPIVRGLPRELRFTIGNGGVWHARVSLASTSRQLRVHQLKALRHYLRRADRAVRWACAYLRVAEGGSLDLGFECLLAAPAPARAVQIAADALAAASEFHGHEIEALMDSPEVAALYLTLNTLDADHGEPVAASIPRRQAPTAAALSRATPAFVMP